MKPVPPDVLKVWGAEDQAPEVVFFPSAFEIMFEGFPTDNMYDVLYAVEIRQAIYQSHICIYIYIQ